MTQVKSLMAAFNKEYKSDLAMVGVERVKVSRIPTGIFALDLATGGGFPRGKTTLLYGLESCMKTTIALKVLANAQIMEPDKTAVFVDVEGHFESEWAATLGVDVDKMGYVIPENAEQVIDIVESLLYADDISLIVVDSLAAMATTGELSSDASVQAVGKAGLAINKFYRKVGVALGKARILGNSPTLILINQIRYRVGVMYGNPETMPGGPSFKFLSYLTIRLSGKDEIVKEIDPNLPTYKKVNATIKKHKIPIVGIGSEFLVSLRHVESLDLTPGDVYDWNIVLLYCKQQGIIAKADPSGWRVIDIDTGEELMQTKTQDEIKARYVLEKDFADRLKSMIFESKMSTAS